MKTVKFLLLLTPILYAAQQEIIMENTNFTLSAIPYLGKERILYNYNRLRTNYTLKNGNWYLNFIGDIDNYLGEKYLKSNEYLMLSSLKADIPFAIETSQDYDGGALLGRIHRFNIGYSDDKQHVVFGLQKISMGVGRIWTPTDLFNPRDPLALEPDQIFPVYAFSYSYALGQTTEAMGVVSQRQDKSYKYAARIKGHAGFADAALDLFESNDAQMIGYELEGDLSDTGIEWRSEGGYFKDKIEQKNFFECIVGIDYGFQNGITAALEWLHTTHTYPLVAFYEISDSSLSNNRFTSSDYIGTSLDYNFNLLLEGSVSMIYNPPNHGLFAAPLLSYTIDDDTSISLGAMLYHGNEQNEFGILDNRYYLKVKKTF
ncbi:MAG: hypothetical protein IE885_02115 [Campylobacterales bacterium]|nr:hypothetical protein [Campylobacterales bacterium]